MKKVGRKYFEEKITMTSNLSNKKGYVENNIDNLIDGIGLDLFYNDLMKGSGNELISKFNALYSSSALAVNCFAIIKKHIKPFSYLGETNFNNAEFERQFTTGLRGTPPNIDFVIESEDSLIAFESKYLEPVDEKTATFKDSYNKRNLEYLDDFWFNLIANYNNKKSHLDIAQLIKHSIGLINYRRNLTKSKRIILVYIYWTPKNKNSFIEYQKHDDDLEMFRADMSKQDLIEFIDITYSEFWNLYSNSILVDHFEKLIRRYEIAI